MIVCGGSAYPRTVEADKFREIADEVDAMLLCDMAHFAGLVAAGLHPNPVPYCDFVTSTTHKTLSGPRSGFVLCREEHAKALDRAVFPGMQGGPMEHVIAAKATCFRIAASARVPRVPDAGARERRRARRRAPGRRSRRPHRRHRHAPAPDRPARLRVDGQGRRGAPRRGEHHGNRNTVPFDERPPTVASGLRVGTPACTMRGFDDDDFREVGRIITGALADDADVAGARRARASRSARSGRCTRASAAGRRTPRDERPPPHRRHSPARPAQALVPARQGHADRPLPQARERDHAAPHLRGDEGLPDRDGRDRDAAREDGRAADLRQEGRGLPGAARRRRDARGHAVADLERARRVHRACTATRRRSRRSSTT